MAEHRKRQGYAKPDYDKYAELELHEPQKWWQALSRFQGPDLAIIAIVAIAMALRDVGVAYLAIACIGALGVMNIYKSRGNYVTSSKTPSKGKDELGRARRGQAETRALEGSYSGR